MELVFWIHFAGIAAIFATLAWVGSRIGVMPRTNYPPSTPSRRPS